MNKYPPLSEGRRRRGLTTNIHAYNPPHHLPIPPRHGHWEFFKCSHFSVTQTSKISQHETALALHALQKSAATRRSRSNF